MCAMYWDRLGYDLTAALHENNRTVDLTPEDVKEVLLELEGENDGKNWHWIVQLESGEFAYITGWCDYTGWDCQSGCEVFRAASQKEAISLSANDIRIAFEGLVSSGEKKASAPDTVW